MTNVERNVRLRAASYKSFVIRHSSFPLFVIRRSPFSELLALSRGSHYSQCLKALSAAFCIASAILASSCADPLEKPITQEAGEKFQRGITGHGTLGPMDRPDDPNIKPSEPDAQHP
jgi:hypothetical protein